MSSVLDLTCKVFLILFQVIVLKKMQGLDERKPSAEEMLGIQVGLLSRNVMIVSLEIAIIILENAVTNSLDLYLD
jgi:hypothetical protein